MAQLAPPQPAETIGMELDAPVIDAAALPPAAADTAAAAADLLQISVAAGQLVASVRMMSLFVGAATNTHRCSCVWRIAV
jgi:hypothetical protein